MELTKLALIKTVMPCVKLEIAEQALQNESNPREQLHQKSIYRVALKTKRNRQP